MSLLANQTAVNTEINLFAPADEAGYVASVAQGSNVFIGGTATNPIINALGVVESITAGSNVLIGGTSNIPVINVIPNVGPSGNNASRYGQKTVALSAPVTSNNYVSLFTIAASNFPVTTSSYLLTTNFAVISAECSNVTGGVGIQINYGGSFAGASFISLVNQSSWANQSNVPYEASIATTFIPNQANSNLSFLFVNNTNGTFSNANTVFYVSITALTTDNTNVPNWA